jgi:hypothetical protein
MATTAEGINSINIILTGSTGMVGEGVLYECLHHPLVSKVLVINRSPCGIVHEKLQEVIHKDFMDLSGIEKYLTGYSACLFCLGISSIGMSEEEYTPITYNLTLHVAKTLVRLNSKMVFCYISGAGTDSSEKGRLMWARVKGKIENDLMKLPFRAVYNFRPAVLTPSRGMKNTLKVYKYFGWMIPLVKKVFPKYICSLQELGQAMIAACLNGYDKRIVEVPEILQLAKQNRQLYHGRQA